MVNGNKEKCIEAHLHTHDILRHARYPLQRTLQVHKNNSVVIDEIALHSPQQIRGEADAVITHIPYLPIAITTADCLPIALYDATHQSCALIHAGWRGLFTDIIESTIQHMRERYGTQPTELYAYIGPAARACCYDVSHGWTQDLSKKDESAVIKKQNGCFFDFPTAAITRLTDAGLLQHQIDARNAICTICSPIHWSYRREKEKAQRNCTIAMLF